MAVIKYQIANNVSMDEFKNILVNSKLGERRPVGDDETLSKMIKHGNLIGLVGKNRNINMLYHHIIR